MFNEESLVLMSALFCSGLCFRFKREIVDWLTVIGHDEGISRSWNFVLSFHFLLDVSRYFRRLSQLWKILLSSFFYLLLRVKLHAV